MKKIGIALIVFILVMFPGRTTLVKAATDDEMLVLRYNAEENFSEYGSPFWGYYFINHLEDSVPTQMVVHGDGLMEDYNANGTRVQAYRYVVDVRDYLSDDHHQYLQIWGGIALHPGNQADVILSFIAPVDGVINISANIKPMNSDSDGIKLYTTLNSIDLEDKVYPTDSDYVLCTSAANTEYFVEGLSVKRGDEIFFRINKNVSFNHDQTFFSPTVEYQSYSLPEDAQIEVSAENITIPEGGIRLLEASLNFDLGQPSLYQYVSSDENIVTVEDNGLIYAHKKGTAEITVTEKESGYVARCMVEVVKESETDIHSIKIDGKVIALAGIAVAVITVIICTMVAIKKKFRK